MLLASRFTMLLALTHQSSCSTVTNTDSVHSHHRIGFFLADMDQAPLLNDKQVTKLLPYHRTLEQPTVPNDITKLPSEIQHIIFDFLIGDAKGKLCCKEVFGPDIPKGIAYFQEPDTLYQNCKSKVLAKRSIYLVYHIPTAASPQFMLTSYDLYKLAHPLYRAICHGYIEAPWRESHRLSEIVPYFSAQLLRKLDSTVNEQDFKYWGNDSYFNWPVKAYPNLKELTMVHAHEYATSNFLILFDTSTNSTYDRWVFPDRCSCPYQYTQYVLT